MFDSGDKLRVHEATDIVRLIGESLAVKKKGKDYVCLCPFHNDRNPSMTVVPGKQIYKCFSCGAGGDCFSWMMDYHKMSFPEALEHLANRAGIKLTPVRRPQPSGPPGDAESHATREEIATANAFACEFFRLMLRHAEHGAASRALLEKRAVSPATIERFALGAAPDKWDGLAQTVERKGLEMRPFVAAGLVKKRESGGGYFDLFRHRLIFPIHNTVGQVVAFGGRRLNDADPNAAKYYNSSESALFNKSATLYGLPQAVKPPEGMRGIREEKSAVVVEGYMDVIACHQAGVCNAVAALGTALNAQGARVLARQCDRVTLLFDGDEAGQKAADRAVEVLFGSTLDVRIATMSRAAELGGGAGGAKDPDELVKQPGGADVLRRVIGAGVDALTYRCDRLRAAVAGQSVQGRARVIEEEIQRLVNLGLPSLSPVARQMTIQRIATLAGVGEGVIREAVAKSRRPGRASEGEEGSSPAPERYRPLGARETALACILAEPMLWEVLTDAQRSAMAPALFEREIAQKLAALLASEAFSAQSFTLSRVRAAVEDEDVVRAAVDFAGEVAMRCEGPGGDGGAAQGCKRELAACMERLEQESARASRLDGLRAGLSLLRPSGTGAGVDFGRGSGTGGAG
ncbi:MAG: DNA primase [Phycisphaerales bacterium]|nr:DNA primase [Phycisphaerales bacterium]